MAGTALSNAFMLSTATVMIGAVGSLNTMTPSANSIGLVKNFQVTSDPKMVELTQGIMNDIVMTVATDIGVKCSMEVYEYTAKNLSYGLGLDGSTLTAGGGPYPLKAVVTAAATSVTIDGSDKTAEFPAGKWIFLQEGDDDYVHVAKVSGSTYATNTTTITFTGYAIPTGMTFSATAGRVGALNKVDASNGANNNFAMKVVGVSPKDQRPFVLLFPKVKIVKGFKVAFDTQNFMNLPFEVTPYAPIPGETGYDANYPRIFSLLTGY